MFTYASSHTKTIQGCHQHRADSTATPGPELGEHKGPNMMTFCKAYRLIPSTVTHDNTTTPASLRFYYCSRNIIPSHQHARQGNIHWAQGLFTYMGHFLSHPCIVLQKGRHKDTLDKLIVVLANIYTHHHVFFFPFPDITIHILLHYLCCYLVVQLKSSITFYITFSFFYFDVL